MPVLFNDILIGHEYSRNELARLWGYAGYQALARGVVTPKGDNKIILFVTFEKQVSSEQYTDVLEGSLLKWEGPTDHFAESRIVGSNQSEDEIHLFYRERHHEKFKYFGIITLIEYLEQSDQPSRFTFELTDR